MITDSAALSHLIDVVGFDQTLSGEPARLQAALRDVVEDDPSGIDLVVASARLGVAALITAGQTRGAVRILGERLGVRDEVAEAVVGAWQRALRTHAARPGPAPSEDLGFRPEAAVAPVVALHTAGPVSCVAWPDGAVSLVTLTYDGLLLRTVDPRHPARTSWRLIATPQAPLSRATALSRISKDQAMLTWTDTSGMWGRWLRRDHSGAIELAEAELLAVPRTGQARYPMTSAHVDGSDIDIFWSADRRRFELTSYSSWQSLRHVEVSSPCSIDERIVLVDCAPLNEASTWLTCTSDRGRLAVARWDVGGREHDGWRTIETPRPGVTGVAMVTLSAGTSLLVVTGRGRLHTADVSGAYHGQVVWHEIESAEGISDARAIAADAAGDLASAVVSRTSGFTMLRLQRYDDRAESVNSVTLS